MLRFRHVVFLTCFVLVGVPTVRAIAIAPAVFLLDGTDPSSASLLYRRATHVIDKPAYRQLGSNVADPMDRLFWPLK